MSVHAQSLRSERPFVTVNCAGLPETLLESELFGHVKGSFTGAYRDKPGMLEKADEGTIFLDEIGEMSLRMQGMLLRFLETGELQKVGADRVGRRIDVRVIAATNRRPAGDGRAGAVPRGPVLPDQRHQHQRAAAARTPRRHPAAGGPLLREHGPQQRQPAGRCRRRPTWRSPSTRGPATCANWRTSSSGSWCPTAAPPSARKTCPSRSGRRAASGSGRSANAGGRWPTISSSAWSSTTSRSGRRCTRSTCSARSPAATCANSCRRASRRPGATTRSSRKLFNMEPGDYKRFLNFLRKHDCQLPFRDYR